MIVASRDHVNRGVAEGFTQANHGKAAPIRRMKKGDLIIWYSGKEEFENPDKCQQFTAIGQVKDDDVYQVKISPDFSPFRRNVKFFPSNSVSILPLIENLQFIKNKKSWGYPFRTGFLEINKHDFDLISSQMLNKE